MKFVENKDKTIQKEKCRFANFSKRNIDTAVTREAVNYFFIAELYHNIVTAHYFINPSKSF